MRGDWREAAITGDAASIAELLQSGSDCNQRDRHGETALMLAALAGRDEVVRLLVAHGADLNITAKYGLSALMLAIINRHEKIARRLVDAGADLSIRGGGPPGFAGKTACTLAEDCGLGDLAAHIREAEG